jgi:hypothetical protein
MGEAAFININDGAAGQFIRRHFLLEDAPCVGARPGMTQRFFIGDPHPAQGVIDPLLAHAQTPRPFILIRVRVFAHVTGQRHGIDLDSRLAAACLRDGVFEPARDAGNPHAKPSRHLRDGEVFPLANRQNLPAK